MSTLWSACIWLNWPLSYIIIVLRYLTRITYLFSADMPHRFPAGSRTAIHWCPRGNTQITSAAMCGSSARQCTDRPWICTIVRGLTRKCTTYSTEDGYQLLNPCSHATAEALSNGQPFCHTHPRYFSILTYIFEAVTKLAPLQKRLHDTSGFRHFLHESARTSCLDSSARYCAENPSASTQISKSTCAGNSRNSSEKCKLSMSSNVLHIHTYGTLHKKVNILRLFYKYGYGRATDMGTGLL